MSKAQKMNSLGIILRDLRREQKLPLHTVASYLEIEHGVLGKIERGEHNPSRELVIKLADYYNIKQIKLLSLWLADKTFNDLAGKGKA